jgi:Putative Flp pilus-assembly TadE/G-like
MPMAKFSACRSSQKGQTLVLVSLCLVVLIAMAALAIDLTTLYVARSEVQRAADAAALAGGKALVDSGVTTDPSDPLVQTLATHMVNGVINGLLLQDTVGGVAPALAVGSPKIDFATHPGNPTVTVTLTRANVPTFFARIFGRTLGTVSATAEAEAYNSSNPAGAASDGTMPPVAPKCVKPWVVGNKDPDHPGSSFVGANGQITNPGPAPGGIIGEQLDLVNNLSGLLSSGGLMSATQYLPLQLVAAVTGPCPSCSAGSNFQQSASCCDGANVYACGGTAPNALVDLLNSRITDTVQGVECLIGAGGAGGGQGQDTVDTSNYPDGPIEFTSHRPPRSGQLISTSNSVATLPIIDTTNPIPLVGALAGQVKVIGFMQVFVRQVNTDGDLWLTVLNVSGCGSNVDTTLQPISGGGVTPVPVRLIHN